MPLLMEDEQYMEDLFNDHPEPIQITTSHTPIKGFSQRLDELQERGCCQKIAWSKISCVASITKDERAVSLRNFLRNPADGKWILGEENQLPLPVPPEDCRIVHLSWSNLGHDLAVLDSAGRVFIFSIRNAIGRMTMSHSSTPESEDELGAVVGLHWLSVFPHQQKSHIIWSATRIGEDWGYRTTSHTFQDPHNVLNGKAALMCVTKTGVLRLLYQYQQDDNGWQEVSTDLLTASLTKDLFTHAAFTSKNDDSTLLVTYNLSEQLHLYRIRIIWSAPPQPKWNGQQQIPGGPLPAPTLDVACLMVEDNCVPVGPSSDSLDPPSTSGPKTILPVRLTHLDFLTAVAENAGITANPTVVATFTHNPNLANSLDPTQPQQNPFSIISRWEFDYRHEVKLHASLTELAKHKRPKTEDASVARLRKWADVYTNGIILSTTPFMYNNILALYQSDGSVDFRNAITMESIHADYSTDKVTSLPQAGFTFALDEPALHVALSGNGCAMASITSDGALKLRHITYLHGSLSSNDEDPKHEAAMASLALQHTSSCNQYFSGDDIFAIIPEDMPNSRIQQFVSLLYHSMSLDIDCVNYSAQESICAGLGKSATLVRCLSAQNTLGFVSSNCRTLAGNLAWATLNVRHASMIVLLVFSYHKGKAQQQGQPPPLSLLRPEMAMSLIGLTSWMIDFMMWIFDDMLRLAEQFRGKQVTLDAVHEKLAETKSPALLLLVCSLPRVLLRDWQKCFPWMHKSAENVVSSDKVALDIRNSYTGLIAVFSDRPSIWRVFEVLITEVDNNVKNFYARAGLKNVERMKVEKEMLISGRVPEVLAPVVIQLLTKVFSGDGGISERINPADIMFRDFSWLGVMSQSPENPLRGLRAYDKKFMVDVLRKMTHRWPQKGVKRVKRCIRGCAFCEDLLPGTVTQKEKAQIGPWYWHLSKSCVCGSGWTVVDSPGEERN